MFKWFKNLFTKWFGKKEEVKVPEKVEEIKKPIETVKQEETTSIKDRLESYAEYVEVANRKYAHVTTEIDHKIPYSKFTYACNLIIDKGINVIQAAKEVGIGSTTLYIFINESLFHVDQDLYYSINTVLEERRKKAIQKGIETLNKYREEHKDEK